jgi:hypothetical protein
MARPTASQHRPDRRYAHHHQHIGHLMGAESQFGAAGPAQQVVEPEDRDKPQRAQHPRQPCWPPARTGGSGGTAHSRDPRQAHPAYHVHLPHLHRPIPFPPPMVRPPATPHPRLNQPVADQHRIHPRPRRHRRDPRPSQFVAQPLRPPARVHPTQLTPPGLHPNRHLVRARAWPVRPVRQAVQAPGPVATQPGMHALPGDPVPLGNDRHRQPVAENLLDRVVALLDHAALPHSTHLGLPARPTMERVRTRL